MVIQIKLGLGTATEEKIYRNVLPYELSMYREGFLANQPYYQWGEMYSLRGKDKTLVHKFGKRQGAKVTKSYNKSNEVDDFDESDEWKERENNEI